MKTPFTSIILALALLFGAASASASTSVPTSSSKPNWKVLAKLVGQSEDARASAIQKLKSIRGLREKIKHAIYTSDRPLALEVITALEMRDLVPELLMHTAADPDGFITLTVNALMDSKNQSSITSTYLENLSHEKLKQVSEPAIIAMLEPLGRLGVALSRETVRELKNHSSPDLRSGLIYFIRLEGLRHSRFDHVSVLNESMKAREFQIRLQAVAALMDLKEQGRASGLPSESALKSHCESEKTPQIRNACLAMLVKRGEK